MVNRELSKYYYPIRHKNTVKLQRQQLRSRLAEGTIKVDFLINDDILENAIIWWVQYHPHDRNPWPRTLAKLIDIAEVALRSKGLTLWTIREEATKDTIDKARRCRDKIMEPYYLRAWIEGKQDDPRDWPQWVKDKVAERERRANRTRW